MRRISFRLGGKTYELDREEVEKRLARVAPKRLDKYFINVCGKLFPPKQVLAITLNKPLVTFTTMDANRVLHSLGFEVGLVGQDRAASKTESEQLFEAYLNASGYTEFRFEREFEETASRPDYSLTLSGNHLVFEIKEFQATEDDFAPGFRFYDPYAPIREKINAARKKFKDLEGYCCCLVLYNREKPLVHLGWEFIYGAMLGNVAVRMPFDRERGALVPENEETGFFGGGGKMVRYKEEHAFEPQNRTISAILTLEQFNIGKRRFDAKVRAAAKQLGRRLALEEYLDMIDRARGTEHDISLSQLRVVVCENPYARIPLPEGIFQGPYDERYGKDSIQGDQITRIHAGEHILGVEEIERAAGPVVDPLSSISNNPIEKRKQSTESTDH